MKGKSMESPWRTVQLFLSSQGAGIFEVEVDTDTKSTRCSCPVWKKLFSCKHTIFVNTKMKLNQGHYSISVPNEVPESVAAEANEDPKKFRDFVVRYAKVEVL
jgi:hypothetical protein